MNRTAQYAARGIGAMLVRRRVPPVWLVNTWWTTLRQKLTTAASTTALSVLLDPSPTHLNKSGGRPVRRVWQGSIPLLQRQTVRLALREHGAMFPTLRARHVLQENFMETVVPTKLFMMENTIVSYAARGIGATLVHRLVQAALQGNSWWILQHRVSLIPVNRIARSAQLAASLTR